METTTNRPIWTMSRNQYQALTGVHRPYICEISPIQYAHMSKRGKSQYDAKREREWSASAAVADTYRRQVVAAFDAGRFDWKAPDVSADAKDAVWSTIRAREEQAAAERLATLQRQNYVTFENCKVGDRVFMYHGSFYGTIVKKYAKSCHVQIDNPPAYLPKTTVSRPYQYLAWMHYNELKAAAEAGQTTLP